MHLAQYLNFFGGVYKSAPNDHKNSQEKSFYTFDHCFAIFEITTKPARFFRENQNLK